LSTPENVLLNRLKRLVETIASNYIDDVIYYINGEYSPKLVYAEDFPYKFLVKLSPPLYMVLCLNCEDFGYTATLVPIKVVYVPSKRVLTIYFSYNELNDIITEPITSEVMLTVAIKTKTTAEAVLDFLKKHKVPIEVSEK